MSTQHTQRERERERENAKSKIYKFVNKYIPNRTFIFRQINIPKETDRQTDRQTERERESERERERGREREREIQEDTRTWMPQRPTGLSEETPKKKITIQCLLFYPICF